MPEWLALLRRQDAILLFTKQGQPSTILTHTEVIEGTAASLKIYQSFSFIAKMLLPLSCSMQQKCF